MKFLFIIILTLFFILNLNAQTALDSAELFFNTKQYAKAVDMYNKTVSIQPTKQSFVNLAKSYTGLRMFDKALYAYSLALDYDTFTGMEKKLFLNILKNNGKYKEARAYIIANSYFNQFELRIIDSIEKWNKKFTEFELKNLSINSEKNDFSLQPLGNDKFIFTSDRITNENQKVSFEFNDEAYLDLYTLKKSDFNIDKSKVERFKKNSNYHDATSFYDSKNNKLYFTRNFYDEKKNKQSNVAISKLKIVILELDSNYKIKNEVDFIHNDPTFNISHPCLDKTGKRLFFVSDMPGGYGGTDIYYSDLDYSGNWSKPINIGQNINTLQNEMFPFIVNNEIYFSSEGHIGFGGLDIFKSYMVKKGENSVPINMGNIINSPFDDFSFYTFNDKIDSGFIASNRPGGKGLDDIYMFKKIKELNEIKTKECKEFIVSAKDVDSKEVIANCKIIMNNLTTGEKFEGMTDSYGKVNFCIINSNSYNIVAENGDFLSNSFDDVLPATGTYNVLLNKKILNKAIEIKNIYYEFNKSYIHPDAIPNLNKLSTLLNNNPDIKVELSSHTDSRGDDNYNMDLSQKRAESVVKYLIYQGIDPARMIAKGYGESSLVNNCTNGVPCPEIMHIRNRRTEFKIVDIENRVIKSKDDNNLANNISKKTIIVEPVIPTQTLEEKMSENLAEKYLNKSNIINTTFFSIQVGAFNKPGCAYDNLLEGVTINYILNNDKYLAIIGNFNSQYEAVEYHNAIKPHFPGSFIVKFVNGVREILK